MDAIKTVVGFVVERENRRQCERNLFENIEVRETAKYVRVIVGHSRVILTISK